MEGRGDVGFLYSSAGNPWPVVKGQGTQRRVVVTTLTIKPIFWINATLLPTQGYTDLRPLSGSQLLLAVLVSATGQAHSGQVA